MSCEIYTVILAAGESSRMPGKIKQLLPWGSRTLLGHAISVVQPVSIKVMVVLGAYAEEIEAKLPQDIQRIINPNWRTGMGSSIVSGIQGIMEDKPMPDGVLFFLADQPFMDTTFLQEMIKVFNQENHAIVATAYDKGYGVPAIFHKSLLSELLKLDDKIGAKKLIQKHKSQCYAIRPKGREVDVDTIEKYNQLIDKQNYG
ncbi:nucleotidyltransferase family protein [Muricauda sp. 2012CJ35-5]|uniref:Nucleotidyltransferase family protein n=1 Tax=Flagellimonas spongiicola TaxID=2942208 RepID=A0ABT0PPS5_9FLAO|nr:nucleotidyltransferase family protein [Allomuricauda spongiicola]MCL6273398.1 nucleotidyltransferase family protein [Allomuricauda spongiicola]